MLRAVLALFAFLTIGLAPASAQRRVALVIGISGYQNLRGIVRPTGDARSVHEAFVALGFESTLVLDADGRTLDAAVQRFTAGLQQDDTAFVYFSGHAARGNSDFLLLAADAPPRPDSQRPSGLGVYALAEDIDATGARAQIFILDACRGDPYAGGPDLAPSSCGDIGRQLPEGSFALFSASAGQKALDRLSDQDRDPHSLFTRTLLGQLGQVPSLGRLARVVRDEVVEAAASVNYQQRPAYLDELSGPPVLLVDREREDAVARQPQTAPPPRAPRDGGLAFDPGPPAQPAPRPPEVAVAPPPPRPPPPEPAQRRPVEVFQCGSVSPGPPAFNCRAARGPVEVAICRDPRLGSCDQALNDVFERAQARIGRGAPALRREEDAWLATQRDACAAYAGSGPEALTSCIGEAYDERIAELERIATSAPPPASRPSFDCRRARTAVEQAICATPALAARDREMAFLYQRALVSDPDRARAVGGSQGGWLAARNDCARTGPLGSGAIEACIGQAYDARIRELRGLLAAR